MKEDKNKNSRRSFLKKAAIGGVITAGSIASISVIAKGGVKKETLAYNREQKKYSPNDQIQVGAIGMGIMGFSNCRTATQIDGVKLVAACDLYKGRLVRTKEVFGNDVATMGNYKEIIDRKDIDAVIISTSDHWHDKITIDALNAGKAVYCEKPMVHKLEEGQAVVDAQNKTGKVMQVGSQRVSSIVYQKARELFKAGAIGQLILAEIRYDRQSSNGAWQYSIPLDADEKNVDWENFIGDAPKRAFDKTRFFRWRNYQDYGTGVAGDLFVHLFSGLHVITDSKGPERIFATGGLRYWKDGRDVPDVILGSYDYPETANHPAFNVQMRVNFVDGSGGGSHIKLIGSEGVMTIGNGIHITKSPLSNQPSYGGWDSFGTFSESMQKDYEKWFKSEYPSGKPKVIDPKELEYAIPRGYSDHYDHHYNFFTAMRENGKVVEDAAFGLRAAGPALASNLSYFEKKIVNWDAEKMQVRS